VLTGELYVAGVVRFFLLPGLAFFAIVFALAAVAFWPCALVALAFALGVASFFLPRLGVRSPALLEEATVHWLSSGLRAE
jgi:hypothetical protein